MANHLLTEEQKKKIDEAYHSISFGTSLSQQERLQKIANDYGISLREAELQDISGVLFKDKHGKWTILVNQQDSPQRKLFTVAHEFGHFFLHRTEQEKFVDSQFVQTCFGRSETTKFQEKEIEANEFAGRLVMPEEMIRTELALFVDRKIPQEEVFDLAKKFSVSALAMETRLKNLGYEIR